MFFELGFCGRFHLCAIVYVPLLDEETKVLGHMPKLKAELKRDSSSLSLSTVHMTTYIVFPMSFVSNKRYFTQGTAWKHKTLIIEFMY